MDITRRGAPSFSSHQKMVVLEAFKDLGSTGKFVPLLKLVAATGYEGRTIRAIMRYHATHNPFPVPLIGTYKGYRLTVSKYEALAYVATQTKAANSILERVSMQEQIARSIPSTDPVWQQPTLF